MGTTAFAQPIESNKPPLVDNWGFLRGIVKEYGSLGVVLLILIVLLWIEKNTGIVSALATRIRGKGCTVEKVGSTEKVIDDFTICDIAGYLHKMEEYNSYFESFKGKFEMIGKDIKDINTLTGKISENMEKNHRLNVTVLVSLSKIIDLHREIHPEHKEIIKQINVEDHL